MPTTTGATGTVSPAGREGARLMGARLARLLVGAVTVEFFAASRAARQARRAEGRGGGDGWVLTGSDWPTGRERGEGSGAG